MIGQVLSQMKKKIQLNVLERKRREGALNLQHRFKVKTNLRAGSKSLLGERCGEASGGHAVFQVYNRPKEPGC